eukprot:g8538.t1
MADVNTWAELQMQSAAEVGLGRLTPGQEGDLNREQRECHQKIDGRQYLFGLQLAASMRLHVLADTTQIPKNLSLFPFSILTLLKAIEFTTQSQYSAQHRMLQDEVNGPVDPVEIARADPAATLTMDEVYKVWMKACAEVTKSNNLPAVNQIPAETAYQRAFVLAVTISLKSKLRDYIYLEKTMKKSTSSMLVMLQQNGYSPVVPAPAATTAGPYNGPNQKGGQTRRGGQRGGGGGGKGGKNGGMPAGGGGKGANGAQRTCLKWMEGTCPGTSRATCPDGHWHCADKQRRRWLNTRFLEGRLTEERMEILCHEVDNSPA